MSQTESSRNILLAPCGMNCELCLGYQREKNKCSGCWSDSNHKPYHCAHCSIMNCALLAETKSKFCYECPKFPCTRLKQLDKRYRTKYRMSMVENLKNIQTYGIKQFLSSEKKRWTCPVCGSTICVHLDYCPTCKQNA